MKTLLFLLMAINNLEIIRKNGVGIAMENILGVVNDTANYITKNNNEDRILCFLNDYLENDK